MNPAPVVSHPRGAPFGMARGVARRRRPRGGNQGGDRPAALAGGMRALGLPDMVWLDRATDPIMGRSLLAAGAQERWRGETEQDWAAFARELDRFETAEPGGAVLGWVEYGGAFEFAGYGRPLCWESGAWRCPGGAPQWWDEARRAASDHPEAGADDPPVFTESLHFSVTPDGEEFCRRVRRAQDHIAAGDIYQVNLSRRYEAGWPEGADPFALYSVLRRVSPAPEAAFFDLGSRVVLCASPEQFLSFQGRQVVTRPIKGTRPRVPGSPARDAASARELVASEKERAELLMITDLLRNELGRVCEFGTVRVPELRRLERFAQVFHLVSTVEGRLRPGVTPAAALRACLPGGSITGAPKRRACEIIAELEAPIPRGLYTGTLGGFGGAALGGGGRFNIAIRTLVVEAGIARFHVGAGIVADSVPELELEETLHKAAGILRACGQASRTTGRATLP